MNTAPTTPADVQYDAPERLVHDVPSDFYNPKTKMSSRLRKSIRRGTWKNVSDPKEAIPQAVKTARKLAALPLAKVLRRLQQTARRASSSKHLLAKLSSISRFRPALAYEQDRQLSILRQVIAEIQHRETRVRI